MQLHTIKRVNENKKRMTVGRGGKRGKTAGRGTKGQNARAGRKKRPEVRDFIKRLPKLRGHGKNSNLTIQDKPVIINLRNLETAFKAGETVSPETLVEKKVISLYKGNLPEVKILSVGEITKKITIEDCKVSEEAKKKIETAGGKVN